MMRKIGIILECGRDGPDKKVCEYLVSMIDPDIKLIPRTLDNKKNLVSNCGVTARLLLTNCEKVIIVWDLYPAWREKKQKPCLHQDRVDILKNLEANAVPVDKVDLVCIHEELEAWLIADERALTSFIGEIKRPHPVGKIPKSKNPDRVRNPKTRLSRILNEEIGNSRKYIDYQDAEKIVKNIRDLKRLNKSLSFKRFVDKLV
jgi:hypothetical protein